MMKVRFTYLFLLFVWFLNGQSLEQQLQARMLEIDEYYEYAKTFRIKVNSWYRHDTIESAKSYGDKALKELNDSLGDSFKITDEFIEGRVETGMKDPFSDYDRKRIKSAQSSSDKILVLSEILREKPYDPLLIELKLDSFKTSNSKAPTYKDELISQFNAYQASFGRRLGRMVQSAMMQEDVYYVTPKSWERFTSSLYKLQEAARSLDAEIQSDPENASTSMVFKPTINIDYQIFSKKVKKIPVLEQQGAYLVTDFRQSYGVGWYGAFKHLDLGLDVLYTGENGSGLKFHPKIGAGKGIIHFAVGGLANTTNGTLEVSGNFYLIFKKVTGGIGVTQNRLLFSIGVNPDFIN